MRVIRTVTSNRHSVAEPVTVAIEEGRSALAALQPEWDALAALDRRDGFFRTHAWCRNWYEHADPDAKPMTVTVRTGSELVGLAPLCERTFVDRWFRMPSIGFAGRETVSGDFLDFLSAPGHEDAVIEGVLAAVGELIPRGGVLVFGENLEGTTSGARVAEWVRLRHATSRRQEIRSCPYIELPSTYDAYLAGLSRNQRSNVRRRTRQLLDEQKCGIERHRGGAAVGDHLDELFRLHEARWHSVGQSGTFVRSGFREFLRALVADESGTVDPELYLMRCGESGAVAALLFFRWGDATLFYQGGWDPEFPGARYSPGLVLFARSISDAIGENLRYYEFLQGDEAYKMRLTTTLRRTSTLLVGGGGIRPRLYLGALSLRDRLRGSV